MSFSIPPFLKLNKKLWRGNLVQNISINASDIGATNDVFNKFKSTAADDSYVYSEQNQIKMESALEQKVKNNAWEDGVSAVSDSLKFVLAGNVKIPTIEQGLQTLNVQSSDGNITIDVSVGNENAKKAMKKMVDICKADDQIIAFTLSDLFCVDRHRDSFKE